MKHPLERDNKGVSGSWVVKTQPTTEQQHSGMSSLPLVAFPVCIFTVYQIKAKMPPQKIFTKKKGL